MPRLHAPAKRLHDLIMLGSLPPVVRRHYGLGWSPAQSAAFQARDDGSGASRPITPGRSATATTPPLPARRPHRAPADRARRAHPSGRLSSGLSRRARAQRGGRADADQSRPRVSPEHRADLRDEERIAAEDRCARLHHPAAASRSGCAGRPIRRRRPRGAGARSRPVARSSAARVRTRSTGSTSSAKVRIGLIFSVVPSQACGAADAPAAAQVLQRVDGEPDLELGRPPPRPATISSAVARRRGPRRGQQHQAHPARRRLRVHDVDPLAPLALARRGAPEPARRLIGPEIPAERCTETISRPSASSGS